MLKFCFNLNDITAMKNSLRALFSPLLNFFEKGDEPYSHKPLNRKILIFMSTLFLSLAILVAYLSRDSSDPGYLLPVLVFSIMATIGLVVGLLGNDRAVAKIWGSR